MISTNDGAFANTWLLICTNELFAPEMAARTWTAEQRKRQARLIHDWKPWLKSSGPKTSSGKAKASRNAFRVTFRKLHKTANYLARQQGRHAAGRSYDPIDVLIGRLLATGIDLKVIG